MRKKVVTRAVGWGSRMRCVRRKSDDRLRVWVYERDVCVSVSEVACRGLPQSEERAAEEHLV